MATDWYLGKPRALLLIYRAFHSLEPYYLQKLLPSPHLFPWQLQHWLALTDVALQAAVCSVGSPVQHRAMVPTPQDW